ncbi:MAG: HAD family hydrolase [Christensenellaceae bacterium]|jgi:hydroxymethylpyrimidine pyrophosphatase-like HAD family hydrolase
MEKTLIVTDLDGTLLQNDATLSEKSKEILQMLIEAGLLFTYATARSFHTASAILAGLLMNIPIIAYSGAFIVDAATKQILISHIIETTVAQQLAEKIETLGLSPLVYAMVDGKERVSWLENKETSGVKNYVASRKGDARLRPVDSYGALFAGNVFLLHNHRRRGRNKSVRAAFGRRGKYGVPFTARHLS